MDDIVETNANLLVALHILIEERSVSRAAQRLGVTQSTMSGNLARLRRLLGDPLLSRVGNEMQLTAKAARIKEHLRRGVDAFNAVLADHHEFELSSCAETFVIAMSDYTEMALLPALARRLEQRAPNVDLRVEPWGQHEPTPKLRSGEVDIMIGYCATAMLGFGLTREPLFEDRWVFIARSHHPKIDGDLTLETYLSLAHVLVTEDSSGLGEFDLELAKIGRKRRIGARVPRARSVPQLVAATDLVAVVDSLVAHHSIPSTPVVMYRPPLRVPTSPVNMIWHDRTTHDPARVSLRLLIQEISAEIQEQIDGVAKDLDANGNAATTDAPHIEVTDSNH